MWPLELVCGRRGSAWSDRRRTFLREDLQRGFEPGACFYIQNATRIRGKTELDLTVDPAPDVVIEVDLTNPSLAKFPIFAQLGVPEV